MKIIKIEVEKFRHLNNITIPLNKQIIAIAGQNGTGKSTLLGLIGHVFNYEKTHKTITGLNFSTVFSEIFQFSYPKYDKEKEHIYWAHFNDRQKVKVQSAIRKGQTTTLRLVVGTKRKGKSKRKLPVIYLGLRRLYPLAQERTIRQSNIKLPPEALDAYKTLHNEILLLDDPIIPQKVTSRIKSSIAPTSLSYDSIGISAGQDNIGQIITALLSFKQLKDDLGNNYDGGILLIDELDATLFAAAQEKLIEKLFRYASDLSLQIIFTTHSLEILDLLSINKYKHHSEIVYLSNARGPVEAFTDLDIESIRRDVLVKAPIKVTLKKIDVYCEDSEARLFIASLLPAEIRKRITIHKITFSESLLRTIAKKKIPAFENSIIVLDGDAQNNRHNNKIVFLPGKSRPEDILFRFLKELPKNDDFWGDMGGYTKQLCFKNRSTPSDRVQMKKWFNEQLPYWGTNASRLLNKWKIANPADVDKFKNKFMTALASIRN